MQLWGLKSKILTINAAILGLTILSLLIVFIVKYEDLAQRLTLSRGMAASQQLSLMAAQAADSPQLLQTLAGNQLEERGVRAVRITAGTTVVSAGPRMHERGELLHHDTATDVRLYQCDGCMLFISAGDNATSVSIEYVNHFLQTQHYQLLFSASVFSAVLFAIVIGMVPVLTAGYNRKMHKIRTAIDEAIATDGVSSITAGSGHDELSRLAEQLNTLWQHSSSRELELRRSADQTARDFRETLETLEVQNIELDIARKEAVKVSQLKSEFLANTSHEIRTPLNGILGFTNLLIKTDMTDYQRERVNDIHSSTTGLRIMMDHVLDFSKIEAGKLTLEYLAFSLYDLLEDCLSLMTPTIQEKPIDLNLIYDADVPEHIQGDPVRLKQVLTNLIHNAIKFTSAGHVSARVRRVGRKEIELSISDTGIGIDKEQQENLFEAFRQADQSTTRHYGGTGLGLAIAQRLITQMGSQIFVSSEPNNGASFYFTLSLTEENDNATQCPPALENLHICYLDPEESVDYSLNQLLLRWSIPSTRCSSRDELALQLQSLQGSDIALLIVMRSCLLDDPAALQQIQNWQAQYHTVLLSPSYRIDTPEALEHSNIVQLPFRRSNLVRALQQNGDVVAVQPEPAPPANGCRGHILLVDDNPANLKLLQLLLDQMDCQHSSASNGEDALAMCDTERFDTILMDIQMPGLSGTETTLRLRQHSRLNKHTPIIAVTAHAQNDERQNFINAGMNDYLGKPIMEEDLLGILEKWCCNTIMAPVAIDLCLQRAGNKADLACDMLSGLISSLPDVKDQIDAAEDMLALREAVHSLHGVCCYSGVPALQAACYQLETAIKDNSEYIPQRLTELDRCIEDVLQWAEEHEPAIIFELDE